MQLSAYKYIASILRLQQKFLIPGIFEQANPTAKGRSTQVGSAVPMNRKMRRSLPSWKASDWQRSEPKIIVRYLIVALKTIFGL